MMVEGFRKNTSRYIDLFAQVADEIMPKRQKPIDPDEVPLTLFRNFDTDLKTFSKSKGKITLSLKMPPS